MISVLDAQFSSLNVFLQNGNFSKIFFLTDENTHHHCLPLILPELKTELPFEILEIEAGEEMKTIETAVHLWEILSEFKADRQSLLINLGGGVITDLGGFVASTYKRGIPFINVPTTLLGMCDASIGGKNGIDHLFLKNIVGTFAMPKAIFVYPGFLNTLPEAELRSGFAEMLKHGLIADKNHWNDLSSLAEITPESVSAYIERSMHIKSSIVEQDFTEQNFRKTLNFGHTVGHALESLFLQRGNAVKHGEAVIAGMICETKLAEMEGIISHHTAQTVILKLDEMYKRLDISSFEDQEILHLMLNDKKNTSGLVNFSLITEVGSAVFDHKCAFEKIINAVSFYKIPT